MGNNSSAANKSAKKERNHSIHEFDFLLDPTAAGSPPAKQAGSGAEESLGAVGKKPSAKLDLLIKAKEKGSFVSKKDILSLSGANQSAESTNIHSTIQISQPLRELPPPTNEGNIVHPAKWLWNHPELTLCMDEHGNTYYYNYNTQESTWDPPDNLSLPKAEITFSVKVPASARPGEPFAVEINGSSLQVMCPLDATAGMMLELSNDTPLYSPSLEDLGGSSGDGKIGVIAEGENEVETGAACEKNTAAQRDDLPATVDDDTLWTALAKEAEVEVYSIKSDAELSRSILTEVANGSYFPELIFQVGWAYKFNLLKGAATACYLSGGSFLDSSQYDNCDGTPRYENAGFVEWLADLQAQRAALTDLIKAGALNKEQESSDEYALLERLALSGDEAKLVEGIVLRKKMVDTDLDNYRSRILAMVSVDGGPTREALDSVFTLLKENVQCEDEDELMDNDEMEEEVSNFLQDRHKFVVDILLTVVLLEEELDSLSRRIDEFETRQREKKRKAEDEAAGNGQELATSAADAEVDVDEEVELLEEQQRSELQRLQTLLLAKKEEQIRILQERMNSSRFIAEWVAELLAEAVRKGTGLSESVVDGATLSEFKQRLKEEEDLETEGLEVLFSAEEKHNALVTSEALAANTLMLKHERDLKALKASLADAQDAQRAALRERLAKKKLERVKDLMVDGTLTQDEAETKAAEEMTKEEALELSRINKEMEDKISHFTTQSLGEIKKQADEAAERLETSLNVQKSIQQRTLMKRLEKRRANCQREMERQAAALGDALTPLQKEALMSAALAKVDSLAEEEAALLEAQNLNAVRAVRGQMLLLVRSEHEKECERLENELMFQKEKRVKDLKSRLERKKAERAKEILSTAAPGTTSAVAVALANEEISAEEKSELFKITSEADAAMEEARQSVLSNLKDLHNKETSRLQEDMKYQEKMQRTNLAHRLDRQRKVKELQLQAEAAAAAAAGSENEAKPTLSEQNLKMKVEAEMKALAEAEEQALQQSLQELKVQQEKEATQLSDELTYKKTSADKRLKERLANRNAKAAQLEALGSRKSEADKASTRLSSMRNAGPGGGGSDEASSFASPAKPALAPIVESEKKVIVDDGSMSAEDYLAQFKETQRNLLVRLDLFIQYEKATIVAQKQAAVKSAATKQKNEVAMNDLAKTSILFDHVTEFMALGLKKRMLYETKAVKDVIAKSKAEKGSDSTSSHRLTVEEVTKLNERMFIKQSCTEASEKIMERFFRDISGLLDSQAVERRTSLAEMKSSGCSASQIESARKEMTEYHSEAILGEVEKVVITLSGVWVDQEHLTAKAAGSKDPSIKTTVNVIDSDEEDEDDAGMFLGSHSSSMIDMNRRKQQSAFGAAIMQWFTQVLQMLRVYSTAPAVLLLNFNKKCAELKFLRSGTNSHLLDLSGEFRTQLQKPLLLAVMQAYQVQIQPDALPSRDDQRALLESTASTIRDCYQNPRGAAATADLDSLFNQVKLQHYDPASGKDSLCADLLGAYKAAILAFLEQPVVSKSELSKLQQVFFESLTPMHSRSGKISDNQARKLQLSQAVGAGAEKLKMELKEKYKKIGGSEEMQARELEELMRAQDDVLRMVSEDLINLEEVNAEGLLATIEKKMQGEDVVPEDVVDIQKEVQKQKQLQRAQKDVQRVLQTASESENKLGVALKIEQAKRQQALHNRLLNKKKKAE